MLIIYYPTLVISLFLEVIEWIYCGPLAQEVRDADDRICLHMSLYAHAPMWSCVHVRRAKVNLGVTQFVF